MFCTDGIHGFDRSWAFTPRKQGGRSRRSFSVNYRCFQYSTALRAQTHSHTCVTHVHAYVHSPKDMCKHTQMLNVCNTKNH